MNAIARTPTRRKGHRGRLDDGSANPIDKYVGERIRLRRVLLGITQEKLAEALGLTFQQVQKYERGTNRVGASRLFDLSRALDTPISFFFDAMPEEVKAHSPAAVSAGGVTAIGDDFAASGPKMGRRELELVRHFHALDAGQADAVYSMIAGLAAAKAK